MKNINAVLLTIVCALASFETGESSIITTDENPLFLLVSFDGFRWDYLKKYNLPNFEYLKSTGSHAEYIKNSFATLTFPNHWTMVTGMTEETHGIVSNSMYDRSLKKEFSHLSPETQTKEWFGQNNATEPIWITNQKAGNGRRSAAEWVGAGVTFDNQSAIYIPFNHSKPYTKLIDEFITLYTRDNDSINMGAMYFDEPDRTGHLFGPYSKEMEQKLYSVDKTLGYLIEQLKVNDLFESMNLIVTSDHGMEEISKERAIFLDSYIDTELFDAYGSRACYNLFIKNETDIEYVYKTLKTIDNMEIYKKHEIPEHLHYRDNVRIGDLVTIAKIGYGVYINNGTIDWKINKGDHGFSNEEKAMFPIFIAHGPAFKKNFTVSMFRNVDIYPLMCYVLGIRPGVNNGTLEVVMDMVAFTDMENSFKIIFIFLVVAPLVLLLICTCIMCRRRRLQFRQQTEQRSSDGYQPLTGNIDVEDQSTAEPTILID